MSSPEPPRRPSQLEYNVRRLLVLIVVFAVITAGFTLYRTIATGLAEKMNPSPSPSANASNTTAKSPSKIVACSDSDIQVSVSADDTVKAGEVTQILMRFSNTSPTRCLRDVGSNANEILIQNKSGKTVWSSNTCPVENKVKLIKIWPGDVYQVSVAWPGTKNPTKCKAVAPAVKPGTYLVIGRNAGAKSEPAVITVQ